MTAANGQVGGQTICLANNVIHDWLSRGAIGASPNSLIRSLQNVNGGMFRLEAGVTGPFVDQGRQRTAKRDEGQPVVRQCLDKVCQCDIDPMLVIQFANRLTELIDLFEKESETRLTQLCDRFLLLENKYALSTKEVCNRVNKMMTEFEIGFNGQLNVLSKRIDDGYRMFNEVKEAASNRRSLERNGNERLISGHGLQTLSAIPREILEKEVQSLTHAYNLKCEETTTIRARHAEAIRELERKVDLENMLRKAECRNEELKMILENKQKNERRLEGDIKALRIDNEQIAAENVRVRSENEQLMYRLKMEPL